MTTQEKINQLTMAALNAAPPSPSLPKPATFTPAPEKLKEPIEATVIPVVIAKEAPALEGADEGAPAEAVEHQSDPEFLALMEERDLRMKKKIFRQRLCMNLGILAFFVSTGIWYSNSARAQAEVRSLIPAFRQSINDVKLLGNILGVFDKHLEKIGTHKSEITDATKSMGVDPSKVSPDDDEHMEKEMNQLTRGQGKSTAQRDKMFTEKFGIVGKLMGDKGKLGQGTADQPKPAAPAH
ncbi:MAG: hypothetical protein ABI600_16140 [Luteolibacter sp.]